MAVEKQYQGDVDIILSKRYDNGADYWTTPDNRLVKGSPFSAYNCALMLSELGMEPSDPILTETAQLFFKAWRDDGRFKLYPKGAIYPCQTIIAAGLLCRLGYANDERLEKTFEHLLGIQHHDGGWRCNKFSYGRGPETEFSNPGPTLWALDMFRHTRYLNNESALDKAVDFLLDHWETRLPLGPCHYGIGTLFMQVEYPFANYNLFQYVYVLSFYDRAKKDKRFLGALGVLESKMAGGKIVVERVSRKLSELAFCKKDQPSELATKRYQETINNLSNKIII